MTKSTTRQLRGTPGIPVLHKLLTRAVQEPGFPCEVSWHNGAGQQVVLEVILPVKLRVPHWQVFLKRIDEKILLGEYHGHDTLMVFKNISAIAESEPVGDLDDAAKLAKVMEMRLKAAQVSSREDLSFPPNPGAKEKPSTVYLNSLTANRLAALASDATGEGGTGQSTETQLTETESQPQAVQAAQCQDLEFQVTESQVTQCREPEFQATESQAAQCWEPEFQITESQETQCQEPEFQVTESQAAQCQEPEFQITEAQVTQSQVQESQVIKSQLPESQVHELPSPAAPNLSNEKAAHPKPKTLFEGMQAPRAGELSGQSAQSQSREAPGESTQSTAGGKGCEDRIDEVMVSTYLTSKYSARKAKAKAAPPAVRAKAAPAQTPSPTLSPPPSPEDKPFDPTCSYTDITAVDPTGRSKLGNLTDRPLTELLLQLNEEQFTGRLRLEREGQSAVVFFVDGLPGDASHGEARGNMALMELFLWKGGFFKITPSKAGSNRSVTWSLEAILQNKANLAALVTDLEAAGVVEGATFKQTCPQFTHEQFLTALGSRTPVNLDTLKLLYQQMDGRKTFADFESLSHFPRYILLRCLHYLLSRNLIFISNKSALIQEKPILRPKKLDAAPVRAVMMSLRNKDTGLLTFPAFLYFLEEEFFRSYRSRSSMSLLLIDLRQIESTVEGVKVSPVGRQTLADAALQIFNCKRQTDGAGHYEANIIAMFLPNTNSSGAATMAKKVRKALTVRPLAGMEAKPLSVMCAIAAIPEDCTNVNSLLVAAEFALQKANSEGLPIVRFSDLDR